MKLIPVYTWNRNVLSFNRKSDHLSHQPWTQGVLLLICVIVAMLLANLPATSYYYRAFLETDIQIHMLSPNGVVDWRFPRDLTIEKLINDVLMVVFFFTVGLEIRREVAHGELSSMKKAMLPIIAAFGGVGMPAIIYTLVNRGTDAAGGWGIPTATDIAFAVCILSVLGDRVPVSLKVFLTALAIADDLIAILVVAIFYGGTINLKLLAISLLVIAFALLLNRLGQKHMWPYLMLAFVVWILFYYSGIHATMSGVVMAFLIPSNARYERPYVMHKIKTYSGKLLEYDRIDDETMFPNGPQRHFLRRLHKTAYGSMAMSYRVEHALSPWVNFLIMPIFALANAGVEIPDLSFFNIFNTSTAAQGVGLGVFLGLVLGKPIGITLLSFISIKTGICAMPEKSNWPMFFAVACLGGIGFTMSIFVDTLSFQDAAAMEAMRNSGKIAILLGSITAGILGTILIKAVSSVQKN